MQKKSLETLLYSTAGILVMLALVVAVNVITGVRPMRLDLDHRKRPSPSRRAPGRCFKKLDTPITIHFYCTQ